MENSDDKKKGEEEKVEADNAPDVSSEPARNGNLIDPEDESAVQLNVRNSRNGISSKSEKYGHYRVKGPEKFPVASSTFDYEMRGQTGTSVTAPDTRATIAGATGFAAVGLPVMRGEMAAAAGSAVDNDERRGTLPNIPALLLAQGMGVRLSTEEEKKEKLKLYSMAGPCPPNTLGGLLHQMAMDMLPFTPIVSSANKPAAQTDDGASDDIKSKDLDVAEHHGDQAGNVFDPDDDLIYTIDRLDTDQFELIATIPPLNPQDEDGPVNVYRLIQDDSAEEFEAEFGAPEAAVTVAQGVGEIKDPEEDEGGAQAEAGREIMDAHTADGDNA